MINECCCTITCHETQTGKSRRLTPKAKKNLNETIEIFSKKAYRIPHYSSIVDLFMTQEISNEPDCNIKLRKTLNNDIPMQPASAYRYQERLGAESSSPPLVRTTGHISRDALVCESLKLQCILALAAEVKYQ